MTVPKQGISIQYSTGDVDPRLRERLAPVGELSTEDVDGLEVMVEKVEGLWEEKDFDQKYEEVYLFQGHTLQEAYFNYGEGGTYKVTFAHQDPVRKVLIEKDMLPIQRLLGFEIPEAPNGQNRERKIIY